jgi:hypothetical protein
MSPSSQATPSQAPSTKAPSAQSRTPSPGKSLGAKPRSSPRRRTAERSDVLVSAVISTYLLTHLHHVLQRAEYGAQQEGHLGLAANYAQLRKVLCLDARTMEDASASGTEEEGRPRAA